MSRVIYFTLRAQTGTGVSHNHHRNAGEFLETNVNEWTGRVEISKEEIPGSRHSMHGLKWRTFELCFFNRQVFNFCNHSTPLQGGGGGVKQSTFKNKINEEEEGGLRGSETSGIRGMPGTWLWQPLWAGCSSSWLCRQKFRTWVVWDGASVRLTTSWISL